MLYIKPIKSTAKYFAEITQLPDEKLTLERMKQLVEGFIEFVWPIASPHVMMVVNEEGHVHRMMLNIVGTKIYGYEPGIAGPCIVATRAEYNLYIRHKEDTKVNETPEGAKVLESILKGRF